MTWPGGGGGRPIQVYTGVTFLIRMSLETKTIKTKREKQTADTCSQEKASLNSIRHAAPLCFRVLRLLSVEKWISLQPL